MARTLRQKKLKLELTFTVSMDEIESDPDHPSFVEQLQQALLNDEPAVWRLMLGAVWNKMQCYADYLAAQDDLAPLKKAAQTLEAGDQDLPVAESDFFQETRPLRISCMDAKLERSVIQEQVNTGEDIEWQPVWRDLRPDSALGQQFERLGIPATPLPYALHRYADHALRVRYLTQQKDGIHVEGRCACQQPFEGIGADESEALDSLWSQYKAHRETAALASKFQTGWKDCLRPGKQ